MRLDVTGDPEIATRINSFEMAFRMQAVAPELMDIAKEPKETLELYGAEPGKASFANNCLLARRLVEKGVRFVQLYHEAWDQHSNLVKDLQKNCLATDRAAAALIKDLKRRGLLDETLVIWGGEFGRTPMVQGGSRRPRPPSQRLHHVDGRRRHQAGRPHRRNRRPRLQRHPATRSTSTTSTPPCSSSWASTTRASPTSIKAATSVSPTSPARLWISLSHRAGGLIPWGQ